MSDCELLPTCGFFKKHQQTTNLACLGFMRVYCKGPQQSECKRREFRRDHGCPPDDDMLPSGQFMPKAFGRQVI